MLTLLILAPLLAPSQVAPAKANLGLPAKIEATGKMVEMKPDTAAERVTYEIPAGVSFYPKPNAPIKEGFPVTIEMSGATEIVFAAAPGEYLVRTYAAVGKSVQFGKTTIVFPAPPPPPPPPPPPKPVDPIAAELLAKFNLDGKPADKLATLIQVYTAAEALVKEDKDSTGPQLMAAIQGEAKRHLLPAELRNVRNRANEELDKTVPLEDRQLTADEKKRMAETFRRLAEALSTIK